jgi:arabinose-5-phosphate isomerase
MTKSTLDIAREALEIEIEGIRSVISRLDENFETVVDLLYSLRGRIIVTGVGKSGIIARKIAATFTSTGSPAIFVHPVEGLHGDVGIVGRDDALIAISNSGETPEITSLAATVRNWGTRIVALTGNRSSTLGCMAQVTLDCRVNKEACPLNLAPTASTTATLALGDALAIALMVRRGFNKEDFLRSHPAGSLGERLNLKVKDMTLESFTVPQVSPSAKIGQIVESINEKNLGLTMVISENRVLGIITDGDLRRALANGTNLFEKEAQFLMTKDPLSIRSDRTAAEALEIMESKLITALSVMDNEGKWLGIIHLHDLLGKGQVSFAS